MHVPCNLDFVRLIQQLFKPYLLLPVYSHLTIFSFRILSLGANFDSSFPFLNPVLKILLGYQESARVSTSLSYSHL